MTKPIATTRGASGTPTGRLAIFWLLASEIVIFGGILASYIMHRIGHPEWANYAAGSLLVCVPVMAMFIALNRNIVSGLSVGGVKG